MDKLKHKYVKDLRCRKAHEFDRSRWIDVKRRKGSNRKQKLIRCLRGQDRRILMSQGYIFIYMYQEQEYKNCRDRKDPRHCRKSFDY